MKIQQESPTIKLPVAGSRLGELEAVIERGLETFIEVGQALTEIRDGRLYRETHGTFETYCEKRWHFSASRARQLIGATKTVTTVTQTGLPAPRNEAVVRELAAPLAAGGLLLLREVWGKAIERYGEAPTAVEVREIVNELTEPPKVVTPAGRALEAIGDDLGNAIYLAVDIAWHVKERAMSSTAPAMIDGFMFTEPDDQIRALDAAIVWLQEARDHLRAEK